MPDGRSCVAVGKAPSCCPIPTPRSVEGKGSCEEVAAGRAAVTQGYVGEGKLGWGGVGGESGMGVRGENGSEKVVTGDDGRVVGLLC